MEFTVRAASGTQAYPLAIDQTLEWQDNTARLRLGDIPEDHIIVPSFSQLPAHEASSFTCSLTASDHHPVRLQRVPARDKKDCSHGGSERTISTHIDCFHSHQNLKEVVLTIKLEGPPLESSLFITTVRPLKSDTALPKDTNVIQDPPKAISQMTAPDEIRQRICSPTATAMCLSTYGEIDDWQVIVTKCFDPISRAYGAWPLAIRAANAFGVHGGVEAVANWGTAQQALNSGHPIVCSINFAPGELRGAPLRQTSGHLVVLYGFDENYAYVMDPAAESSDGVPKRYDLAEFSRAWLHERGAAYIFARHAHTLSH